MNFVLRKQARQPVSPEDVQSVEKLPITILEVSSRMIVVDGDRSLLTSFVENTPGWLLAPVVEYSLPESPRENIRNR